MEETAAHNKKLRAGIIGLGCRGVSMTGLLAERDDLDITAVCDVYDDRISMMQEKLAADGRASDLPITMSSSPLPSRT